MAFINKRKVCKFCADKKAKIDYKEYHDLKKFLNSQGKIIPRRVTGLCTKHQRQLVKAVKRARNIALLPYSYNLEN
ncbi:MAG: 30S ribosomal protein S18 [Candidatus Marinimicrobia bacterium]|nr:30S ribosomal protein S18 [Candidatus Neomarinimicrobiota bacterium]